MNPVQVEKILAPVDFSECSEHALDYALALAQLFEAELVLLHVVELPFLPSYSMAGVPDLSLPVEQLEETGRQRMEKMLEECRESYPRVEADIRTGAPFVEVIDFARENEMDLVVMGTHGRSGLKELLIGSVAEKVVRKAPCPVLTVRHPEQSFEMP